MEHYNCMEDEIRYHLYITAYAHKFIKLQVIFHKYEIYIFSPINRHPH
jgi:hypothetical protein